MNTKAKSNWIIAAVVIAGILLGVCAFTLIMIALPKLKPISEIGDVPGNLEVEGQGDINFDTALSFHFQQRYAEAIPYLDLAIDAMPENGDAYYLRAFSYFQLSSSQRNQNEFEDYLDFALADVDKAIIYGVTRILPGDPYSLRYLIYSRISSIMEYRAEQELLDEIALDNLRMAMSFGASESYNEQWIPLVLFSLNRCDEGIAEIVKLREYYGLSAPPSASMYNIEAQGYLCFGQLDKALEYVNKGLDIEIVRERVWLRSMILYIMGRGEEALEDLNRLIAEKPYYNGYRYFLRALIQYENGRRDLAEEDLRMGAGNTWERWGIYSYILGRMAVDEGDNELGIGYLQYALATLDWYYRPMFPRIAQELAELGAEPLPEETGGQIWATPMPAVEDTHGLPPQVVARTVRGFPEPPNITLVDIAKGTGYILGEGHLYPYPVYLFRPHIPISIESVQRLVIHLEPESQDEPESFEIFLWNLTNGEWDMLKPGWGSITVEEPERYVDYNGDTYLAIRWDNETIIHIRNAWLTIEVTDVDGKQITLGTE